MNSKVEVDEVGPHHEPGEPELNDGRDGECHQSNQLDSDAQARRALEKAQSEMEECKK